MSRFGPESSRTSGRPSSSQQRSYQSSQMSKSPSRATESNKSSFTEERSNRYSTRSGKSPARPSTASIGKKKSGFLSGLLSSKEPSMAAFAQMEAQMKAQQSKDSNQRVNPVGMPGVSSATLPASVPKVNSKWDGVPQAMKQQEKDAVRDVKLKGDRKSMSSSTRSHRQSRSARHPNRKHASTSTVGSLDSGNPSESSGVSVIIDFEVLNEARERAKQPPSLRSPSSGSLPDISYILPKNIPPPPAIPDRYKKLEEERVSSESKVKSLRRPEDNAAATYDIKDNINQSATVAKQVAIIEHPPYLSDSAPAGPQVSVGVSTDKSAVQVLGTQPGSDDSRQLRPIPTNAAVKDIPEHSFSPLPTPTESLPPTPEAMVYPTLDEAEAFFVGGTTFLPIPPPTPPRSHARVSSFETSSPSYHSPPCHFTPKYESHGFLAGEAHPVETPSHARPFNIPADRMTAEDAQRRHSQASTLSENTQAIESNVDYRPDSSAKRLGLTPVLKKASETAPWDEAESTSSAFETSKGSSRFSFLVRSRANT
ncbi:MAG: hypothetical protein Q9227_004232 [Pyrenula ochraceoflavens]